MPSTLWSVCEVQSLKLPQICIFNMYICIAFE